MPEVASGQSALLLMRHAKSSWDAPHLQDHDRPLKKRGRKAARRMAEFLQRQGSAPAKILSSSAVRARQTAEIVAQQFPSAGLEVLPQLYHALPEVWHQLLSQWNCDVPLLVVGHNPGMELLISELAGHPMRFPTAAIAQLNVRAGARTFAVENLMLADIWTPRGLEESEQESS